MELKHATSCLKYSFSGLLIVPYGIETLILSTVNISHLVLLIVPYGIETVQDISIIDNTFSF